jgi:putative toxin-antitoxin system antitoxin component (TIGR02293 family)
MSSSTGEQRIVIRDVSFEIYASLADAVVEGSHVHLAFDGRDLEIMTPDGAHEHYRDLLRRFVTALTFGLRIRSRGAGSTTWKRPEIQRGIETDLCYYFTPEKLAADADARGRKSNKVADYPNPDMAVEIDLSPSGVDQRGIYSALKVAELWHFDGHTLVIEHLQSDGTYRPVDSSRFLPVRAEGIRRWLVDEDSSDELAWEDRLRTWASRIARILPQAVALFAGDVTSAWQWLSRPQPGLGGSTALDHAATEPGARAVENLIGRLEHGFPQ